MGWTMTEAELLELAWGLICNTSNTPIEEAPVNATPGWSEAAVRFRDAYFAWMDNYQEEGDHVQDGGQWGTLVRCNHCQDKNGLLFKPDHMPEPIAPEDSDAERG
jgi:hypothetical protein